MILEFTPADAQFYPGQHVECLPGCSAAAGVCCWWSVV